MTKAKLPIDDSHHVLRFLPSKVLIRDLDTEELKGAHAAAFEPRERDKGALSVTWVEFFKGFTEANVVKAINAFKKAWGRKLDQPLFALGNVGAVKKACAGAAKSVRIVHEPSDKNPAHAAIRRLQDGEAVLFDQLAHDAFADIRDENAKSACPHPKMGQLTK
jgi:hypothetical protein